VEIIRHRIKMISRYQHWILFALLPLSQLKEIFYKSDLKVSWYLFSEHKRYLCNVVEDYSNILIFGIIFYLMAFHEITNKSKRVALFLFIINFLDLLHLGFLDMQYLIIPKLILATIITLLYDVHKKYL